MVDDPRKRARAEAMAREHYGADWDAPDITPERKEAAIQYFMSQVPDETPNHSLQDIARNPVNPKQGTRVRNIIRNQAQGRAEDYPQPAGVGESILSGAHQGALTVGTSIPRALLRGAAAIGVPHAGDARTYLQNLDQAAGVPEDRTSHPYLQGASELGGEIGMLSPIMRGVQAGAGALGPMIGEGSPALGRLVSMLGREPAALDMARPVRSLLGRTVSGAARGAVTAPLSMPDETIDNPTGMVGFGAALGGMGELAGGLGRMRDARALQARTPSPSDISMTEQALAEQGAGSAGGGRSNASDQIAQTLGVNDLNQPAFQRPTLTDESVQQQLGQAALRNQRQYGSQIDLGRETAAGVEDAQRTAVSNAASHDWNRDPVALGDQAAAMRQSMLRALDEHRMQAVRARMNQMPRDFDAMNPDQLEMAMEDIAQLQEGLQPIAARRAPSQGAGFPAGPQALGQDVASRAARKPRRGSSL